MGLAAMLTEASEGFDPSQLSAGSRLHYRESGSTARVLAVTKTKDMTSHAKTTHWVISGHRVLKTGESESLTEIHFYGVDTRYGSFALTYPKKGLSPPDRREIEAGSLLAACLELLPG